jgi:hypothetical protein
VSSLQTARFRWVKVWQRDLSVNQCAAVRARVVLLLPLYPFPSRSDVLVVPPATQLDRRVAKTSRLHEKSYPPDHEQQDLLRCQECARKQRTITVEISSVREEKREKSDPWVRSLVKECATRSSSVQVILYQHHLHTLFTHLLDHLGWCILLSDDACESFERTKGGQGLRPPRFLPT